MTRRCSIQVSSSEKTAGDGVLRSGPFGYPGLGQDGRTTMVPL